METTNGGFLSTFVLCQLLIYVCVLCIVLVRSRIKNAKSKRGDVKKSAYYFLILFVIALLYVMYKEGPGALIIECMAILFALILIIVTAIRKTFPKTIFNITLFFTILSNIKCFIFAASSVEMLFINWGIFPTNALFFLFISYLSLGMLGLYYKLGFEYEDE